MKKKDSMKIDEERCAKNSAARLSIIVAGTLIVVKTVTGFLTGSISVWASLLDSTMDIFASTVNFFAIRTATRAADEGHPYGHGKAESLAGLFQSIVIATSGIFLMREAIRRIIFPKAVESEIIGIATMVFAIVASWLLVKRLRTVAKQTNSPALSADALHYITDVYINGGVLIALAITALTDWQIADPIISIVIALYIIWSAIRVAKDSIEILMDARLPVEVDDKVADIVNRFKDEGVVGFHNLRTRRSGSEQFIDLHLEITKEKTFEEAHNLTEEVIKNIETEIPRSRVQIHSDPVG
jgi:ferrous-iron efflux pump FieF